MTDLKRHKLDRSANKQCITIALTLMTHGAAILDLDLVASEIQFKKVFWLKFLTVNSKMTSSTSSYHSYVCMVSVTKAAMCSELV